MQQVHARRASTGSDMVLKSVRISDEVRAALLTAHWLLQAIPKFTGNPLLSKSKENKQAPTPKSGMTGLPPKSPRSLAAQSGSRLPVPQRSVQDSAVRAKGRLRFSDMADAKTIAELDEFNKGELCMPICWIRQCSHAPHVLRFAEEDARAAMPVLKAPVTPGREKITTLEEARLCLLFSLCIPGKPLF
jgi:hypothetical protein